MRNNSLLVNLCQPSGLAHIVKHITGAMPSLIAVSPSSSKMMAYIVISESFS
jgi:hypothetical protein